MLLTIVTPSETVCNTEVESVTLPSVEGSFTVLHSHAPIIAQLTAGEIIYSAQGKEERLDIRSGFPVVFSPEPVREGSMILCEEQNKKSNVGTISYMPAVFGCACASVAIRTLLGEMQ